MKSSKEIETLVCLSSRDNFDTKFTRWWNITLFLIALYMCVAPKIWFIKEHKDVVSRHDYVANWIMDARCPRPTLIMAINAPRWIEKI